MHVLVALIQFSVASVFLPQSLLPDYQRLSHRLNSSKLIENSVEFLNLIVFNNFGETLVLVTCYMMCLVSGDYVKLYYFQNKLVDTIHFMEILNLKDTVEKDSFFRKLPNLAEQLPRPIVLKKLVPLLASALEFGSAAAPALAALLKMGSWLLTEEFSSKVMLFQALVASLASLMALSELAVFAVP
uniref:Uncharacterized protein n=1 Tax=Quercus lobata TaxID=97700 RepID=A0A7N2MLD9_QUELO